MHANLSITDGVYGILLEMDVREQITLLGKNLGQNKNSEEFFELLEQFLSHYKKRVFCINS
jgi:ABC-type Fe3+-hydroxamate transport system substrate-binding protein